MCTDCVCDWFYWNIWNKIIFFLIIPWFVSGRLMRSKLFDYFGIVNENYRSDLPFFFLIFKGYLYLSFTELRKCFDSRQIELKCSAYQIGCLLEMPYCDADMMKFRGHTLYFLIYQLSIPRNLISWRGLVWYAHFHNFCICNDSTQCKFPSRQVIA